MISTFTPVIKQLMIDGILHGRPSMPKVNAAGIFVIWLAAIFTVMGLGFLLYAEFAYLHARYSLDIAALGVASTAFLLACILGYTGIRMLKRHALFTPRHSPQTEDITKTVGHLIDSLAEELEGPIRENPKTAIMIASLAGFLTGDHQRH